MNKAPLVSIIIPNYNYANYVGETIDSVLKQTYSNFECIVVDDGSTDNSVEVIETFAAKDHRIKLIKKTNGGLSTSRNEGIKVAKGEFLAFLDSDDLWLPKKLENQMNLFLSTSNIDIIYSNSINFNAEAEEKPNAHVFIPLTPLKFIETNCIPGCSSSIIIKKNLILSCGYFDPDLRGSEDQDFLFRCALVDAKFSYCDQPDVKIRKHSSSMLTNYRKQFFNNWYCFEKNLSLLKTSKFWSEIRKDNLNKAIELRIQSLRWLTRNDKNTDLILITYSIGISKIGFRYLFKKFTLSNIFYDLRLWLKRK